MTTEQLIFQLREFDKNKDWNGAFSFVGGFEIRNNPLVWNDDIVLEKISFATLKLAEVSINLKYTYRNDEKGKDDFLKGRKKMRDFTIEIRKRCIELSPEKSCHYSNLAYCYYSSLMELSFPGGRRDGRAIEEATNALKYLTIAIEMDENRIPDLYRKGRILVKYIPDIKSFIGNNIHNHDQLVKVFIEGQESIKNGITVLKLAVQNWEKMKNEYYKKRYRKDYINCLYTLGKAYSKLIKIDFDGSEIIFKEDYGKHLRNVESQVNSYNLENVNNSKEYFSKCVRVDTLKKGQRILDLAKENGEIEGVNKLYSIGKTFLKEFLIISINGRCVNENHKKILTIAKEYLNESLITDFPRNKERQNKIFIAEKLGRVYNLNEEYSNAIAVIEKFIKEVRFPDYYVLNTLGIAYTKSNQFLKATECFNKSKDNKGNKEIWLSKFLIGCSLIVEGKIELGRKEIEEAKEIAVKNGKKNIDSLLIANAIIAYKENKTREGINFLNEAFKMNPKRYGIIEKVINWENSLINNSENN